MNGIDTNILPSLWLNDAPAQNQRIDSMLAAHGRMPSSLLVTHVVLVESVWTLRSAFEQDKHAQSLAVRSLLEETAFASEDREAVCAALSLFETGSCGFGATSVISTVALMGSEAWLRFLKLTWPLKVSAVAPVVVI